ncbi:MAG TPA: hypothetical protein VJA25_15325, partial [Dehalococcoidia bacterium]|nr:hypothetical protein [Dehalococcoidia bacterium]
TPTPTETSPPTPEATLVLGPYLQSPRRNQIVDAAIAWLASSAPSSCWAPRPRSEAEGGPIELLGSRTI